jgi:hypothetical protein
VVTGSWIILDEQITNWIEWLGALLVMLSVTFYLYMQFITTPASDSPDAVRPQFPSICAKKGNPPPLSMMPYIDAGFVNVNDYKIP